MVKAVFLHLFKADLVIKS